MSDETSRRILDNVHENVSGLRRIGLITTARMREFDELCLVPSPPSYAPEEIKAIRERLNLSQPVFASYLNVTKSTVAKWEQGVKKPTGSASRLIQLAAHKGLDAFAVTEPG